MVQVNVVFGRFCFCVNIVVVFVHPSVVMYACTNYTYVHTNEHACTHMHACTWPDRQADLDAQASRCIYTHISPLINMSPN